MIAASGRADCVLDTSFNAVGFGSGATVYAIAPQADGKVIVGGVLNYQSGYYSRSYLARFTSTGALDTSFNPAPNGTVYAILIEPDGKIIITGAFTTVAGMTRYHIARLLSDGSVDYYGFNPPQPNHYVVALARQSDGKILIGGAFTILGGVTHTAVARLNTDGSRDTSYYSSISGGPQIVYSIAVYPAGTPSAGKILVGGNFATAGGLARTNVARLNANGLVDSSFVTRDSNGNGAWLNGTVYSVAMPGRSRCSGVFSKPPAKGI